MSHTPDDNPFTKAVNAILLKIDNTSQARDSIFQQAELFYVSQDSKRRFIAKLEEDVQNSQQEVSAAKVNAKKADARTRLVKTQKALSDEQVKQDRQRYSRLKTLQQVCVNIIELSEGKDWQGSLRKSAKLLGTLMLFSPCEGKNVAHSHKKLKPLYKAVLAMRLLDQLLKDNKLDNKYVLSRFNLATRYSSVPGKLSQFQRDIAIPVISAALLQDIGLQHPEIQRLLKGPDGSLDEFRILDKELRVPFLIMNHEQTLEYIALGLGSRQFEPQDDNSVEYSERKAAFIKLENNKSGLMRSLLNDAIKPKFELGNVLKVAQIYTSIVLSTKPNFNYSDLPKAALVIERAAQKGAVSEAAASSFIKLVGHFPQGYGVVFVRPPSDDQQINAYDYAIVNALCPRVPFEPHCKIITTRLQIAPKEHHGIIRKSQNLYYEESKQQLANLGETRLQEIAQILADNLGQPKRPAAIPGYWLPHGYFYFKKQQNIWN